MSAPNPSAFPVPAHPNYPRLGPQPDMTLRDWFAGQALAGSMAAARITGIAEIDLVRAHDCYLIADAMLAERAKAGAE